ncbi:MAG TPA: hypothetical protein VLD67_14350 [Vicinamibacterales bacterium]|nr:hypothetical protein [Vicinamibacterales bacterium]
MLRFRPIVLLDAVALALLTLVLVIVLTGGFYTEVFGLRVSARGVERPFALLAALVVLRIALDRTAGALGLSAAARRRLREAVFRRAADPEPPAGPLQWGALAFAAVGVCGFGVLVLHAQLRHMDGVPDLGDPLFSIWRMGWVYQQLRGDPRPLFDANIFHPDPLTLTYSDSMLLPAVTAAPLLALGVHPVHVYNVLFLSGFLLSAIGIFLLVQQLTGSSRAAFVSALLFGFYPYRFEHYSHFELQMAHWLPLALLALHRFAATARIRYAIAASLCVAAQLYSAMYYALFFVLHAGAILAVLLVFARGRRRALLIPGAGAALLAVLLATPLARVYIAAHEIKGERDRGAVERFSAERMDYLRPHHRSATYGDLMAQGPVERALFPGVVPLALAAVGAFPPIGVTRVAYAAGLLVAFDGSLGLHGTLYPYLYEYALPFKAVRVPARFSIVVGMTLAVLAGFGVRRILHGRSRASGGVILGLLVAATAIDVRPVLTLQPVWRDPPPIYEPLRGLHGVVLAEFPFNTDPMGLADNTSFMYFSLWHWSQMVNGYSGYIPAGYYTLAEGLNGFPDPRTLALLRSRGVTHVSVNCALPGGGCEDLLDALSASRDFRPVASARWQGWPVRLFELAR